MFNETSNRHTDLDTLIAAYEEHLYDPFLYEAGTPEHAAYIREGVSFLDRANELGYTLTYISPPIEEWIKNPSGHVEAKPL